MTFKDSFYLEKNLEKRKNVENTAKVIEEKFYFCPYCRTVSLDNTIFYKKEKINFRCLCCNEIFNAEAYGYVNVKNGGKAYKLIENDDGDEDVQQAIATEIAYLYWDGYTHREIQKKTRFSQDVIRKAMQYIYEEEIEEELLTIKQFFRKKLDVSEREWKSYKSRENNTPIDTIKNFKETVVKAYNFGCTYADIEKLLKVSSKTISSIINSNRNTITLDCNHKIVIQDINVNIIKKKRYRKTRINVEK